MDEIVLQNQLLEVAFNAETQVVITGEETFDVVLEDASVVEIDSDYIEVVTLSQGPRGNPGPKGQRGPRGNPGTKVTVSATPPVSPRKGDIWFVKT